MDYLLRAISGSERSKERTKEVDNANKIFQAELANIRSRLEVEDDELQSLLEMIYDSSFPESQVFLKDPTGDRLKANKDTISRLLSGLSARGVPVTSMLLQVVNKHGVEAVTGPLLTLLELVRPLLASKDFPEFTSDDLLDAMDYQWHTVSRSGSPGWAGSRTESPRVSVSKAGSPRSPASFGRDLATKLGNLVDSSSPASYIHAVSGKHSPLILPEGRWERSNGVVKKTSSGRAQVQANPGHYKSNGETLSDASAPSSFPIYPVDKDAPNAKRSLAWALNDEGRQATLESNVHTGPVPGSSRIRDRLPLPEEKLEEQELINSPLSCNLITGGSLQPLEEEGEESEVLPQSPDVAMGVAREDGCDESALSPSRSRAQNGGVDHAESSSYDPARDSNQDDASQRANILVHNKASELKGSPPMPQTLERPTMAASGNFYVDERLTDSPQMELTTGALPEAESPEQLTLVSKSKSANEQQIAGSSFDSSNTPSSMESQASPKERLNSLESTLSLKHERMKSISSVEMTSPGEEGCLQRAVSDASSTTTTSSDPVTASEPSSAFPVSAHGSSSNLNPPQRMSDNGHGRQASFAGSEAFSYSQYTTDSDLETSSSADDLSMHVEVSENEGSVTEADVVASSTFISPSSKELSGLPEIPVNLGTSNVSEVCNTVYPFGEVQDPYQMDLPSQESSTGVHKSELLSTARDDGGQPYLSSVHTEQQKGVPPESINSAEETEEMGVNHEALDFNVDSAGTGENGFTDPQAKESLASTLTSGTPHKDGDGEGQVQDSSVMDLPAKESVPVSGPSTHGGESELLLTAVDHSQGKVALSSLHTEVEGADDHENDEITQEAVQCSGKKHDKHVISKPVNESPVITYALGTPSAYSAEAAPRHNSTPMEVPPEEGTGPGSFNDLHTGEIEPVPTVGEANVQSSSSFSHCSQQEGTRQEEDEIATKDDANAATCECPNKTHSWGTVSGDSVKRRQAQDSQVMQLPLEESATVGVLNARDAEEESSPPFPHTEQWRRADDAGVQNAQETVKSSVGEDDKDVIFKPVNESPVSTQALGTSSEDSAEETQDFPGMHLPSEESITVGGESSNGAGVDHSEPALNARDAEKETSLPSWHTEQQGRVAHENREMPLETVQNSVSEASKDLISESVNESPVSTHDLRVLREDTAEDALQKDPTPMEDNDEEGQAHDSPLMQLPQEENVTVGAGSPNGACDGQSEPVSRVSDAEGETSSSLHAGQQGVAAQEVGGISQETVEHSASCGAVNSGAGLVSEDDRGVTCPQTSDSPINTPGLEVVREDNKEQDQVHPQLPPENGVASAGGTNGAPVGHSDPVLAAKDAKGGEAYSSLDSEQHEGAGEEREETGQDVLERTENYEGHNCNRKNVGEDDRGAMAADVNQFPGNDEEGQAQVCLPLQLSSEGVTAQSQSPNGAGEALWTDKDAEGEASSSGLHTEPENGAVHENGEIVDKTLESSVHESWNCSAEDIGEHDKGLTAATNRGNIASLSSLCSERQVGAAEEDSEIVQQKCEAQNYCNQDEGVTAAHANGSCVNSPALETQNEEKYEDNLPSFHMKRLRRLPGQALLNNDGVLSDDPIVLNEVTARRCEQLRGQTQSLHDPVKIRSAQVGDDALQTQTCVPPNKDFEKKSSPAQGVEEKEEAKNASLLESNNMPASTAGEELSSTDSPDGQVKSRTTIFPGDLKSSCDSSGSHGSRPTRSVGDSPDSQGPIAASGPIYWPHSSINHSGPSSGNVSCLSESNSASTPSFAVPVAAKMAKHYPEKQRWRWCCLCCSRPSS